MEWRERIVEGFPPPYRGEPASLRRDIEDELADHLALATGRELARTGDEAAARKAAVERFGNPRALARQLWFEAMKERIMKDRIMTVAMCLLAIAAILGGVFAYKAFEQSRQTSQAMIAALEKLAAMKQNETMTATETAMATFKVVDESGKPVEGVTVSLSGQPFTEKEEPIEVKTNADGISEYGPMRMGKYTITIAKERLKTSDVITLYQGHKYEETITVPNIPMVKVKPRIDLPPDLLESPLLFVMTPSYSIEASDHRNWTLYSKALAINTNGKVYEWESNYRMERRSPHSRCMFNEITEYSDGLVMVPSLPINTLDMNIVYRVGMDISASHEDFEYSQKVSPNSASIRVEIDNEKRNNQSDMLINFDDAIVKDISYIVVVARDNENHHIEDLLISKIDGRLVGVRQVLKDCWINKNNPEFSGGVDDLLILADYRGGSRMLVDWDNVNTEDVENSKRRYLLAWYIASKKDRLYKEAQRGGFGGILPKILAFKILEDWPEVASWNTMPKYEEEPLAEYSFDADQNKWAIFDVTSYVEGRDEANRPFYGLMLGFDKEIDDPNEQNATGYHFFSRERTNTDIRPMLLIVEPDEVVGKE